MTHSSRWLLLSTLVALVVLLIPATPASAQPLQCRPVTATLTGQFGMDEKGLGWIGDGYLSINGDAPLHAKLRDASDAPMLPLFPANQNSPDIIGEETLTFTLDNGDMFQMKGYFVLLMVSEPYACDFHETGNVVAGSGTGMFSRATGSLALDGQVVYGGGIPAFQWNVYPWMWLARARGSMCLFPGDRPTRVSRP